MWRRQTPNSSRTATLKCLQHPEQTVGNPPTANHNPHEHPTIFRGPPPARTGASAGRVLQVRWGVACGQDRVDALKADVMALCQPRLTAPDGRLP